MKIAYDYQIFTDQSYGGISRYYTILAVELLKQSQDVGVFAGIHRNNYVQDLPKGVVRGFKLSKYPPKTVRIFKWLNHGISQVQMNAWQPDIIHETYYSSLPSSSASGIRVTSVYDMIHELFSGKFSRRDKTTGLKMATFSRVDHILSISHSTKKDLIELFGIDESKISVVHLGVDLSNFQKVDDLENNPSQKPYLLYVGNRGSYKNFTGLLHSVASSRQLQADFDILAFGGGRFNADELVLIKKLGFIESQVQQVGGDDEVLAMLYRNAEAFVYPSLYEGFGLPPLEAMSAGCPVISSNTSSMPEVVRNAGEYFNPNEVDDIRDAIIRVVYSQDKRNELIALGFENIKDFSWKKCSQETLYVYNKLAGNV